MTYLNPVRDREAWVAARGYGIGGSDAGVLMRWNRYTGVGPLWRQKTGIEHAEFSSNRFIDWGNNLEPVLLWNYAATRGVRVLGRDWGGRPVIFPSSWEGGLRFLAADHPLVWWLNPLVSPARSYARANIDGYELDGNEIVAGLEAKNTGQDNGPKWDPYPPPSYLAQCLHNRQVIRECGLDVPFRIMVLVGGNNFGVLTVGEHTDYLQELMEREARFWHHVETMTKPSVRRDFPRVQTPTERDKEEEMGFTPPPQKGNFEVPPCPTGTMQAIIGGVVDQGVQESEWNGEVKRQHKFTVHWLLDANIPDVDEDGSEIPEGLAGQPYMVWQWMTVSLHEKSNLRALLKGLRGHDVSKEEERAFKQGKLDLSEMLIGTNALVSVSVNDRGYGNIESAMPLPKGMAPMELPPGYGPDWLPHSMREQDEGVPAGVSANEEEDDMPF